LIVNILDTSLRIRHPCPFCDFSSSFPDAEIVLWCNGSNEVLQISAPDPSALPEMLKAARKVLCAREMVQDGRSAITISRACGCEDHGSVMSIAGECGVWLIPPVVYLNGWETHRALSEGKASLQRFIAEVKRTGNVQVLSHQPRKDFDIVNDLSVIPAHLFGGLTPRQVRALVLAFENGLLEIPAKIRMDRIARGEGVSRSTFGEHLRKAQLQLIRNSYPFLKLRDAGVNQE
jgi:predicted DNA binding protein